MTEERGQAACTPSARPEWRSGSLAVSIEGIDGSGKSTLVKAVEPLLRAGGIDVLVLQEFASPIGPGLESCLANMPPYGRAYAFAAEQQWLLQVAIEASAQVILWDRYVDSAWACRATDVSQGRAGQDLLEMVDLLNQRLPLPHLTFRLRVPIAIAAARARDRQRRLNLELVYDELPLKWQDEHFDTRVLADPARFVQIDGRGDPGGLARQVVTELIRRLPDGSSSPAA